VYIRDCAERLHMEEKVLTTEVVNLRRKNREEDVKKEAKEEKKQEATTAVNMPAKPVSALEQNYYNLIQLIVRYGERPVEIEDTVYTIGDVIIYTLEGDEIKAPQPVYQTIIDEFKRHSKDEGFKAETFFKFHPDPQVSALAIDMIADKYRFVKADSEARLGELVTQLLYEIKLTVVNIQIEEVEKWLKEAQANNDWERQMQLLAHQPELLAQRNEICKILGNRVISI
jgi:DNA primase